MPEKSNAIGNANDTSIYNKYDEPVLVERFSKPYVGFNMGGSYLWAGSNKRIEMIKIGFNFPRLLFNSSGGRNTIGLNLGVGGAEKVDDGTNYNSTWMGFAGLQHEYVIKPIVGDDYAKGAISLKTVLEAGLGTKFAGLLQSGLRLRFAMVDFFLAGSFGCFDGSCGIGVGGYLGAAF